MTLNNPVKVYDANNAADAELIREQLANAEIECYIDATPSPLDGLTAMGQGTPIFVDESQYNHAIEVVNNWLGHEHKPGYDDEG